MHEISLNIDNGDVLTEFLNLVIDQEVSVDSGRNLLKSWKDYGFTHQDELDLATRSLSNIFAQYARGQIDQKTLKSYFSYLNPELQEKIVRVIEGRKDEILRHLVFRSISSEQKALVSFDWDVKWILGSSSSSTVQKLITSLTLNCRKDKNPGESVHVEMDREYLDKLIRTLEDCERHLENKNS